MNEVFNEKQNWNESTFVLTKFDDSPFTFELAHEYLPEKLTKDNYYFFTIYNGNNIYSSEGELTDSLLESYRQLGVHIIKD
jgi:hypothetical protein